MLNLFSNNTASLNAGRSIGKHNMSRWPTQHATFSNLEFSYFVFCIICCNFVGEIGILWHLNHLLRR